MLSLLQRGLNLTYQEWKYHLVPRFGSSILLELYAYPHTNSTNFTRSDYFVSVTVDDVPVPFRNSSCEFDGDKYRCNWASISSFLESRSLQQGLESICFSHLENRIRPLIIDGNMPWWLAFVISAPLVGLSLYFINYKLKQREERKKQAHALLDNNQGSSSQFNEFRNVQ